MVFVFYNKLLLRGLVFLTGALCGVCAWHYIALSSLKLGQAGVRDALAIVSFLLAGWLVMLIAEVADNHYVRAFGALCYLLGAAISFKWIFLVDGPMLSQLAGGAGRLQMASLAFWIAAGGAVLLLVILTTRLIIDKMSFGRLPEPTLEAQYSAVLGTASPGQGEAAAEPVLAPLTPDPAPLLQGASSAAPERAPAPVSRLHATEGPYRGQDFVLRSGAQSIGRQNADILLELDSQVSRSHALLELGPDGLATLRDSGSTNGTWVNGQRSSEIVLAPGDTLQIGLSHFRAEA
jgi:hypothetical protein